MGDEADWAEEQYEIERIERLDRAAARAQFWASIGRRPPQQHRQPFDDDFERVLYDVAAIKRGVTGVNKAFLEKEVARQRDKLARTEARLEAIEGIPDRDPFTDRVVLVLTRGQFTYAVIRVSGRWWSTGTTQSSPHGCSWAELVNWLVDGNVESVNIRREVDQTALSDIPMPDPEPLKADRSDATHAMFPVERCSSQVPAHAAHLWDRDVFTASGPEWAWCHGG